MKPKQLLKDFLFALALWMILFYASAWFLNLINF